VNGFPSELADAVAADHATVREPFAREPVTLEQEAHGVHLARESHHRTDQESADSCSGGCWQATRQNKGSVLGR
jgi:hypothetical protein